MHLKHQVTEMVAILMTSKQGAPKSAMRHANIIRTSVEMQKLDLKTTIKIQNNQTKIRARFLTSDTISRITRQLMIVFQDHQDLYRLVWILIVLAKNAKVILAKIN